MILFPMQVKVKLFAGFRDGRFKERLLELEDGSSVRAVVKSLGINQEDVGVTMLNSRHCSLDSMLRDGDILAIFPVIGGG